MKAFVLTAVLCLSPFAAVAADCNLRAPVPSFNVVDYKGECRNGYAHGRGVALVQFPSETGNDIVRVDGQFEDGNAHGQAVITSQSGRFGFNGVLNHWHRYNGVAFEPHLFGIEEKTFRDGQIVSSQRKSKSDSATPGQAAQDSSGSANPLGALLGGLLNKKIAQEQQRSDSRQQAKALEAQQRVQQADASRFQAEQQRQQAEWARTNEEQRAKEAAAINAANRAQAVAVQQANDRARADYERQAAEQRAKYERDTAAQRALDAERNRQYLAEQQRIQAEQQRQQVELNRKAEEQRVKDAAAINAANRAQAIAVQQANERAQADFNRQAAEQRARFEQEAAAQRARDITANDAANRAQALAIQQANERSQAEFNRQAAAQRAADAERARQSQIEQQRVQAEDERKRQELAKASPAAQSTHSSPTPSTAAPKPAMQSTPASQEPVSVSPTNRTTAIPSNAPIYLPPLTPPVTANSTPSLGSQIGSAVPATVGGIAVTGLGRPLPIQVTDHFYKTHVDQDLRQRLLNEPDLRNGASKFFDRGTADKAIREVVAENDSQLRSLLEKGNNGARVTLRKVFSSPVGKHLISTAGKEVLAREVVVVVERVVLRTGVVVLMVITAFVFS